MNRYFYLTLFFAFILMGQPTFAQTQVRGVVYHDANNNGKRDRKEKGIPDVAVSNGVEVVSTDKNGQYVLPVEDDNIIFVIKPAGYSFPLDDNFLSKSYYIHKPLGSPDSLRYRGSAPTGPLPSSLDFALYEQQENDAFKAFIFGDPQAYNLDEIEYFKKGIIQDIKSTDGVAFGISLGDLVGDDLVLHTPYQNAIAALGLPWYNVMGNHDMNYDVQVDSLSDETFEKNFGPANFAFNYGNAHFIILDNILYPHPKTGRGYWGGFREDQLKFLENNLKHVPKDKLIVLAYHIPLILPERKGDHVRSEDRQRFFDLIAPFPNTVSLSAHTHFQAQLFFDDADGFTRSTPHHEYNVGTTSGDWYSGRFNEQGVPHSTMRDGTPKGYAVLHIDGNQYKFDYQVAGRDAAYQIQLTGAEKIDHRFTRRYPLYANFFMGDAESDVQYRIDGGKWQAMQHIYAPDPAYIFDVLQFDHATNQVLEGKRPSDPVPSTHLWRARYPQLSTGTHQVEVRAQDRYGKRHYVSKTIEVIE